MIRLNPILVFAALLLSNLIGCEKAELGPEPLRAESTRPSMALIETFETNKSFEDVIFELDFAITERNYRITGRNTIGKGLRDRGYNDFPDVEVT